jgi:hypothetical protein
VLRQLLSLAERAGALVTQDQRNEQSATDPLMRHIERNLFASPFSVYGGNGEHMTIFGASDRRAEAESLAEAILEFARNGVRYRDMAVVVSDLEAYAALISRSCERRGIPVFLDRKHPLTGHAAIDGVLAACALRKKLCVFELHLRKSALRHARMRTRKRRSESARTGARGNAMPNPHRREPEEAARERARRLPRAGRLSKGSPARRCGRCARSTRFSRKLNCSASWRSGRKGSDKQGASRDAGARAGWNLLASCSTNSTNPGGAQVGKRICAPVGEGLRLQCRIVPGTADHGLVGTWFERGAGGCARCSCWRKRGIAPRPAETTVC